MAEKPNFTMDPMPDPSNTEAFAAWLHDQLQRIQDRDVALQEDTKKSDDPGRYEAPYQAPDLG